MPAGRPRLSPGGSRTTARGYDGQHKRARLAALEALHEGEDCCPFCRRPMFLNEALDFDHELPIALGGKDGPRRLSHASCNRRAGARLGNRSRAGTAPVSQRCWCNSNCLVHVPVGEL